MKTEVNKWEEKSARWAEHEEEALPFLSPWRRGHTLGEVELRNRSLRAPQSCVPMVSISRAPTSHIWRDRRMCVLPVAGLPEWSFRWSLLLRGSCNHLPFLGSRSLILQWLRHLTPTSLSATSASTWVTFNPDFPYLSATLIFVSSLPQGPCDAALGHTLLTVYIHCPRLWSTRVPVFGRTFCPWKQKNPFPSLSCSQASQYTVALYGFWKRMESPERAQFCLF